MPASSFWTAVTSHGLRLSPEERAVLSALHRRYRQLSWILARKHFLALLPTDTREGAQLYLVLGGRLVLDARVTAAADLVAAVAFVAERLANGHDATLERGDVAASTVLVAWLRDRRQEGLLLPFDTAEDLVGRLDELAVTLDDLCHCGSLPRIDGLV